MCRLQHRVLLPGCRALPKVYSYRRTYALECWRARPPCPQRRSSPAARATGCETAHAPSSAAHAACALRSAAFTAHSAASRCSMLASRWPRLARRSSTEASLLSTLGSRCFTVVSGRSMRARRSICQEGGEAGKIWATDAQCAPGAPVCQEERWVEHTRSRTVWAASGTNILLVGWGGMV